jgi:hypothetical protein
MKDADAADYGSGNGCVMRKTSALWTDDERLEFIDFLARNPGAGDRISGGGGVRKVRWVSMAAGSEAESASFISITIQECRFIC